MPSPNGACVKYVLHAGTVYLGNGTSVTISAEGLAELYKVPMDECVLAKRNPAEDPPGLIHLRVRRDGIYMVPSP